MLAIAVCVTILAGILLTLQLQGLVVEKPESLKIGVIVYPGVGPFFIAQEKGFFEKEGVNAEVVTLDPVQIISALKSNNVQIATSTADFTTIYADTGVDVKEIFMMSVGYGSDGLLVKNDVSSIKDLKGKNIYLSLGTPSHFLLRVLAKESGLLKDDITLIHMEPDQVGVAFAAEQVDYGMSWEPWLSKASERKDGKILFSSKDRPGFVIDTIVTRDDVLQVRKDEIKAVMKAWFDAIEFWRSNPEEANAIMARNLGLPVEDFEAQLNTVKFLDYKENLAKFDKSTDLNIFEVTEKAIEIYIEDGIIKSNTNSDDIIDPVLLTELY